MAITCSAAATFQVAEKLQAQQFAVLDWTGGGGEVGAGGFQCSETGAGTVGGDFHHHPFALGCLADDVLFVGGIGVFTVDFQQTLVLQKTFDQRRAEIGADGVGTLNTQCRAVFRDGQGGGTDRQPCTRQKSEQNTQGHAGTESGQGDCRGD